MKGRDPLIMKEAIQSNQTSVKGDQSNMKDCDHLIVKETNSSNLTGARGN